MLITFNFIYNLDLILYKYIHKILIVICSYIFLYFLDIFIKYKQTNKQTVMVIN